MPKLSSKKPAGRTVRRRMADGTIKTYHYSAWQAPEKPTQGDTIRALIRAFEASPEFAAKAPTTQKQYLVYLRPWLKIADTQVAEVRRRDVLAARDAIAQTRGAGAASAFGRVAAVLFGWAVDREWIESNPAGRIKALAGGALPAWTEAQISHALAHLREDLRRVALLGLYTGQRRGDLISLTWAAYDGSSIRLRQAKTGVLLVLPVHPILKAELDAWKAERADSLMILTTPRTGAWKDGNFLSHEMAKGLKKIDLPAGLNVHGLRKAAARRLAEAGCTVHEIASITGHRSLQMVQHYTTSADQQRLAGAAVARLPKKA